VSRSPSLRALAAFVVVLATVAASGCGTAEERAPESFEQGSVLPDLALVGYVDRNGDGVLTPDEHGPLRARDVVSAHPSAELVLLHVAFEWCKYCWEETSDQIAWSKHHGGRLVAMQVMVQDRDGNPADRALLDSWIDKHESALVTVLEPEARLFDAFGQSATYLLLDARDNLRILAVGAGPPQFDVIRDQIGARLGSMPPRGEAH
jgi:hypothetical protein